MKNIESVSVEEIESAEDFRMPWGAHKGKKMGDLPNGYISWLAENIKNDNIASRADLIRRYRERWNIEK